MRLLALIFTLAFATQCYGRAKKHTRAKRATTNELGCNADMSDAMRYQFVNNHNVARQLIAGGTAPNKCGALPTAQNMYKMFYDCDLEARAKTFTDGCTMSGVPSRTIMMMYMLSSTSVTDAQLASYVDMVINAWFSKVIQNGIDDTVVYSDTQLASWSMIANGETTLMGCHASRCPTGSGTDIYVACSYEHSGNVGGETVYEPGPQCTTDADCTTYSESICQAGLCVSNFVDDGTSVMCPQPLFTDAQRQAVLDMHNNFRSSGARGLEHDPNATGTLAPKAKNMYRMTYNCSVEANAYNYAQGCVYAHSDPSQRPGLGENLYMTSDNAQPTITAFQQASKLWWKELSDFGVGDDNILTSDVFARGVGHYTQMAWQNTVQIGCASINCPSMTYVVCQYAPQGNYMNQIIYEKGEPCSGCPSDPTCTPEEGLCAAP